ncbi:hypothetical protein HK102_003271, partial [Quaeritorhiza haematococci]
MTETMDSTTPMHPQFPALLSAIRSASPSQVKSLITSIRQTPTSDTNTDLPLLFLSRDPQTNGASALHIAASTGNKSVVQYLLSLGHPWNAVDDNGRTAGEYAKEGGFEDVYEALVEEGCRVELILGLLDRKVAAQSDSDSEESEGEAEQAQITDTTTTNDSEHQESKKPKTRDTRRVPSNQEYLHSKLHYTPDGTRLLDSQNNGVMMGWEAPLMALHADLIAPTPGLSVLNIGFGLGIIDTLLQDPKRRPKRHVIVEAHPDVYRKMREDGWDKKEGVEIVFGRWQDVVEELGVFDGVFFDTFGEFYEDLKEFHDHIPNLLTSSTSLYTFFNGLGGTNPFFHDVYCRIAAMDLQECGVSCEYIPKEMEELGDEVWRGVARPYFSLREYRVPI